MANPLLERYSKKKHGTKSERRVGKALGARMSPGSGSLAGAKGDAELPEFLVECKSTIKDSLGVKLSWLVKIEREALEKNKAPALTLSFVFASGQAKPSGDWVCVPSWLAKKVGLLG